MVDYLCGVVPRSVDLQSFAGRLGESFLDDKEQLSERHGDRKTHVINVSKTKREEE